MILRFEDVSYRYPAASEPALREVSLEVSEGEVCLLAGLSGQGKSTLLQAACALVPHFQGGTFAGRVRVTGLDTRDHGPASVGAQVGVLFQEPETQLVTSSVRAEISLPLAGRGHDANAVARGVEEVALAIGVDHLLQRGTAELSGGEKQRVALAAALVGRPRLVLLDEPTSQLDPVAADELLGLLHRLNQEWETTIVMAEHRLERCLRSADRVIALDRGRIVHDGDPSSFLSWAEEAAPALQTPGARLLSLAGVGPPPVGVRQARATLRRHGLLPAGRAEDDRDGEPGAGAHARADAASPRAPAPRAARRRAAWLGGHREPFALDLRDIWLEISDGPAILKGVSLAVAPGESVALMGKNGAGTSTLLRVAAGLTDCTRGRVRSAGRVALLLQSPGDYFLRDRVALEASAAALARVGLADLADRHPKDLSGGERQRLALAVVTDGERPPAVLALDEPTRGMDREAKEDLARQLRGRAQDGQAVILATHDPEFAAACTERAVMLADGGVIADGPSVGLLAGGWYFATETARILGGRGGALLPEDGARLLEAGAAVESERVPLRAR